MGFNMGKTTGFLEYSRELAPRRPVTQRVNDWFEIYLDLPEETLKKQGAWIAACLSARQDARSII
jgi:glutamate synthase (NADPH/NADH) small chain